MDFLHSPLWNFIVWISTILSLIVAIGTIIEWVLKLKTPARSVRAYTYSYFKSIRYSRTFIDRFSAFLPITSFLFLVFLILLAITQFMSRSYLSAFLISSLVIVLFVRQAFFLLVSHKVVGYLTVIDSGPSNLLQGTKFDLLPNTTIGSSNGNTIQLSDNFISSVHARIWKHLGNWYVQDAGSTNGTYVNNQPAYEPLQVKPGDTIQIGFIRFELTQHDPIPVLLVPAPSLRSPFTMKQKQNSNVGGVEAAQALSAEQLALLRAQFTPGQLLPGIANTSSSSPNSPRMQPSNPAMSYAPTTLPLALPSARLTIRRPQGGQQVYRIEKPVINIGRQLSNDIIVDDKRVSRNHAQIKYQPDGQFAIFDLGSTNGITVNGIPHLRQYTLRNGDHFSIGSFDFYYN